MTEHGHYTTQSGPAPGPPGPAGRWRHNNHLSPTGAGASISLPKHFLSFPSRIILPRSRSCCFTYFTAALRKEMREEKKHVVFFGEICNPLPCYCAPLIPCSRHERTYVILRAPRNCGSRAASDTHTARTGAKTQQRSAGATRTSKSRRGPRLAHEAARPATNPTI